MNVPPHLNPAEVKFIQPVTGTTEIEQKLKELKDRGVELVLVIIPQKGSPLYGKRS